LAWFDENDRFNILKTAKSMLKDKEYDLLRGALMFLFYTGSRAEALKNVRFEERKIKVNGKELIAVIAITLEKGRHGKKQWEKPIKTEIYFKYIKGRLPISEKEIRWLRRVLKRIYEKCIDKNSVKYEYAMKHSIHIWRHTAAMTLLHATDWNIGLVAEILGWENPEILFQIYGRMPPEKKIAVVYGIEYEKPKFEFLSELEEKAKRLGLL
ncbi:MAG: tyrosine-type recombinase/integrase, partial [Candidatus Heimdallarchaeaceae archaeon]